MAPPVGKNHFKNNRLEESNDISWNINKFKEYDDLQNIWVVFFVQVLFWKYEKGYNWAISFDCRLQCCSPISDTVLLSNTLLVSWKKLWSLTRTAPPSVAAELLLNLQSLEMILQSVSRDTAPPPAPSAVLLENMDLVAYILVFLKALITPPSILQVLLWNTVSTMNKTLW